MTQYPDLFGALAAPFPAAEVKSRSQGGGKQVSYITARTVQNRLDDVLGPENWWDDYIPGAKSVLCKLTIRLPDGSTLTKCDAGGYAGMADQGDDDKSGYSDAFKRAAVKFGVARYLYRDGVPSYAGKPDAGADPVPGPGPAHATPTARKPRDQWGGPRPAPEADRGGDRAPTHGRALFAWTKERQERLGVDLLKYLNQWGRLQGFPGRMVDWDEGQVKLAFEEACRKLDQHRPAEEPQEAS